MPRSSLPHLISMQALEPAIEFANASADALVSTPAGAVRVFLRDRLLAGTDRGRVRLVLPIAVNGGR